MPGKKERSEAVGALRQLARDAYVQPQLWQRVQQLEGSEPAAAEEGGASEGGAAPRAAAAANGNGSAGGNGTVYDHATVSMALKVGLGWGGAQP